MDTGLTQLDEEVLRRVRENRDARLEKESANNDNEFQPVIHYGEYISKEERKVRQKARNKELALEKKAEKEKEQSINVAKDDNQPLQSASEIAAKEPHNKRGSISPTIQYNEDATILTWHRHFIKDNMVLLIPRQIPFETGMLELTYNTKDKALVVKPIKLANLGRSGAL